MGQEKAELFTRLAPVLNVRDLAAERAFYESSATIPGPGGPTGGC